jgi:MFS family permease
MLGLRRPLASLKGLGADRLTLLGTVVSGHAAIHWYQQLFPVVLPSIKAGLGLNDVQVGALSSAREFSSGGFNLPSGVLADSLVRHRAVILASSLLVMGAAYLLMGVAPGLGWAIVASGLMGLGTALWHPAAMASLSTTFPQWRATALSVHGMGATISDTLTPLAVGALLLLLHWRHLLQLQMVPALVAAFLVWRSLAGFFGGGQVEKHRRPRLGDLGVLVRNPSFLGVTSANSFMQSARIVVITFLPIYLQEHLGYSPFVLGFYITLLHAMGTVSQPMMGYFSDRLGRKAVLFPSFVSLGVLYILLWVVSPGVQLGTVIALIGIFFYTLTNVTSAAIMDVAGPSMQASSFGLSNTLSQLFTLPVPIIAGYLIGVYGIGAPFILAGAFMLIGAAVLAPLRLYRGTG